MRSLLAAAVIGAATFAAVPAFAQSVYIGPGGIGVDPGIGHRYGYDRGYDRYRDRGEYRRDRFYEGRSAYERDGDRGDRGDRRYRGGREYRSDDDRY